jgi:hypothetical protein
MNNTLHILAILILLLNCKRKVEPTVISQPYIPKFNLKTDLADFTTRMTEKDTINIIANLTMEDWIRQDLLVLSKKGNEIKLSTRCEETYIDFKKTEKWISDFKMVTVNNANGKFEKFFVDRIKRTVEADPNWIYKIISNRDTLTFYSYGLSDKGGEIPKYYDFMSNLYPNEREFKGIEVLKK